ncbi:hypothetical protein K503DRAFT_785702 [Rhizopogon vinicolor AM-OR11-026]|uniref:Uncharacterized protein n=1 Tax=Rhizopogon vinicolor AM-OR11-026 TaxID=1314800 RepID=A0A1B7MPL9_9AGAM|nr:hypothetical protein K503DRAFT_785702 [Rhizopogon vinicolor AM-OR11-026]
MIIPLHTVGVVSRPHWDYGHMLSFINSPHSSAVLNPTPSKQPHCSNSQDKMSPLATVLLSSKLRQHKTNRHCMLLGDLNNLARRGKQHSISRANHKAKLRHRCRKLYLLLHRRLLHLPRLIVLPPAMQQQRSHNLLPPARVPRAAAADSRGDSRSIRISTSLEKPIVFVPCKRETLNLKALFGTTRHYAALRGTMRHYAALRGTT